MNFNFKNINFKNKENKETIKNYKSIEDYNYEILQNISKDYESMRLQGMKHDDIKKAIEIKYLGKIRDKNYKKDNISSLIDFCLGKD